MGEINKREFEGKTPELTLEERRAALKEKFMQKWRVSGRDDEGKEKTFEELFKTLSPEEAQEYIEEEEGLEK